MDYIAMPSEDMVSAPKEGPCANHMMKGTRTPVYRMQKPSTESCGEIYTWEMS